MRAMFEAMATILEPGRAPFEHRDAANRLADLFTELTAFEVDRAALSPLGRDLVLPSGMALSPFDAALCLREYRRTMRFHHGIRAGLERLLATRRERPLRVVYAGCGPFAALVTPLLPLFDRGDVVFHLLEANELSLALCRTLLRKLGLEDFVAEFWLGDATARDDLDGFHMLISETLQVALGKEPQVAIAANLAPRLCDAGIMIPERISLIATLLDPAREGALEGGQASAPKRDLGTAFELDRSQAQRIHALRDDRGLPQRFEGERIEVPEPLRPGEQLWIRTRIQVFENTLLGDYESSLTVPSKAPLERVLRGGEELRFSYELVPTPGLRCRVLVDGT